MTYKEYYNQCESFEDLKEKMELDAIVQILNPEKIKAIQDAGTNVAKSKGWLKND